MGFGGGGGMSSMDAVCGIMMCAPGVPERIIQGDEVFMRLVGRQRSSPYTFGINTTHKERASAIVLPLRP